MIDNVLTTYYTKRIMNYVYLKMKNKIKVDRPDLSRRISYNKDFRQMNVLFYNRISFISKNY